MMKLALAITMLAVAIDSINGGVLIIDGFAKVNGWTFYKIKTKGTMTNFNVHKTCESNNLITPCYTGTYDTFNSEACQVVFPKTVTEDADTMQYLSIMICGHREPGNCEILQDLFVYKENWLVILLVVHWKTSTVHTESNSTTYGLYVAEKTQKMLELATPLLRNQLRRQEEKLKPKLLQDNLIL